LSVRAYGKELSPPRPGLWEIDLTHFPRPVTRYLSGIVLNSFGPGFSESCRVYGLLVEALDYADIGGFMYSTRRTVGAASDHRGGLGAEVERRCARAREVIATKAWREDLFHWDEVAKPAAVRGHLAIQCVDPRSLDTPALAAHVVAATKNENAAAFQHGRFTMTAYLPVGDYLAHAAEWTGLPPQGLLRLVKGYSDISQGVAAPELTRLRREISSDPKLRSLLDTAPAAEVIAALREWRGPAGSAARAWLDAVGYRIVTGYDLSDYYALEIPDVLVSGLKSAVRADARPSPDRLGESDVAAVRDRVPAVRRDQFDELLAEARLVYRLREERDHYSDGWATGLLRRVLLEAGRRLADAGRVDHPEFVLDTVPEELDALLRGRGGPSNEELAERVRHRKAANPADMPPSVGVPIPPAFRKEALPPEALRLARAVEVFVAGMLQSGAAASSAETVRGIPVSPGTYEGPARVVSDADQFGRVMPGDVLVARSTSPYFNVLLPLLGAIVTDHGGALSHAAIVSREYGIPGVVGTKVATKTIRDGQRIRVDGDSGEVRIIR
jgi:pyruvate,water dikinase